MFILTKEENELLQSFKKELGIDLKPCSAITGTGFHGTNHENRDEIYIELWSYHHPIYYRDLEYAAEIIVERRDDIDDTVKLELDSWNFQEMIEFYKKNCL